MRAALYARVSDDKRQDASNQLPELREYAAARGWKIAHEYIDGGTGSTSDRAQFQRLFIDASRRKFDVVIVWALDRFTREGVSETFAHIRRLRQYGVQFESYTEAQFRTTGDTADTADLMLALSAWIAEQERRRMIERINAGIEKARKRGTTRSGNPIGPPKKIFNRDEVLRLKAGGMSNRKIGFRLGISEATVRRVCRRTENATDD